MFGRAVWWRGVDVRVGAPGAVRVAVGRVECRPGVTALVGRNGAGKSSLLAVMAGDVAHGGEVSVAVASGPTTAWPRPGDVTLVPHEASAPGWWRVDRCLEFGVWLSASETPAVERDELVSSLGLKPLLNRRFRTLSAGEGQRVALAMGLLQDSGLYLLDEPTGSVDLALSPRVAGMLNGVGRARSVVVATHDLALLRGLDAHVVWLEEGRVHVDSDDLDHDETVRLTDELDVLLADL